VKNSLREELLSMDSKSYKLYKKLRGCWPFQSYEVHFDHVQSDPFAPASKIRVRILREILSYPDRVLECGTRQTAFEDYLARVLSRICKKSNSLFIEEPSQLVLKRSLVLVARDFLEIRLSLQVPARGRRIDARRAVDILYEQIPDLVDTFSEIDPEDPELNLHLECIENQNFLRKQLEAKNCVSFVANGSKLARSSGDSQLPMKQASPFSSPLSLQLELKLKHPVNGENTILGMGVPTGVTLITGGGYHGKSTLLKAIESGIYNHIPGDGREYLVSLESSVRIQSEEGRQVSGVDISSFLKNLPRAQDLRSFGTQNASGSTSMAASLVEAMELDCKVLFIDEDTSASNLLSRHRIMEELVPRETIQPLVEKVRSIYEDHGVSSILVMGADSSYLGEANCLLMMEEYECLDVKSKALHLIRDQPKQHRSPFPEPARRTLDLSKVSARRGKKQFKSITNNTEEFVLGENKLPLQALRQFQEAAQLETVARVIHLLTMQSIKKFSIKDLHHCVAEILQNGLDRLHIYSRAPEHPGYLAQIRPLDALLILNRIRSLSYLKAEEKRD